MKRSKILEQIKKRQVELIRAQSSIERLKLKLSTLDNGEAPIISETADLLNDREDEQILKNAKEARKKSILDEIFD